MYSHIFWVCITGCSDSCFVSLTACEI